MRSRFVRGAIALLLFATMFSLTGIDRASAQTRNVADGPWAGWVRCEISAQGPGYRDQQTHTWVMTGGAPRVEGVFRIYPATWTVVGGGSLGRTQTTNVTAEWATSGQSSNAPIAVWTRGDGRLVFALRHDQLRAPSGFTGYRFYTTDGKDQARQAIATDTYEYRFQPIDDAPANTISGSSMVPSSNAFAPTPQPGSTGSASCTWQFVQSATPIAPPTLSSAAATGTTSAAPTTLRSAGSPTTIQSTATQTEVPAPSPSPSPASALATISPTSPTLNGGVLAGTSSGTPSALTTLVAFEPTVVTITPEGVINGAFSGPTKLTPGAKGTFQLTLTGPSAFTSTAKLPSPPPTIISYWEYSTAQIFSKTTSRTTLYVSLTFDSNEGETVPTGSLISESSSVAPSATFTFQTAGTYSVSVSGMVTVQTRLDIVNTTETTFWDGSGKPISMSTTTEAPPPVITVKQAQVSARLQLTVAAQ